MPRRRLLLYVASYLWRLQGWPYASLPDETEELGTETGVVGKPSGLFIGGGERFLFLHTTHLHAEVLTRAADYHALVGESLGNDSANLRREPFLHLQPAREAVDYPREFREADYLPFRYIADGDGAEEGEYMVLAKAMELYILDYHYPGA